MELKNAYYVGIHQYSFRSGEPAKIEGIYFYTDDVISNPVACFKLTYADGAEDYCPISDIQNYKIISENVVRSSFAETL